jgi:hypothetical protein
MLASIPTTFFEPVAILIALATIVTHFDTTKKQWTSSWLVFRVKYDFLKIRYWNQTWNWYSSLDKYWWRAGESAWVPRW